ncbi:hypothetical protein [Actinomadura geliboluensis]|uniref:hypothetical protein n=1 Tax=Actinomadura geliboluensis TaxID=882440 RepID=UPI003711C6E2
MAIRVWAAGLAVPLVLGPAACGSDDGGGVATAGGAAAKASVSASASASLSPEDARLKFAQCMRENGVDVPDPGAADEKAMRFGKGSDRKKLEGALEKCRQWLQAGGKMPDLKDPEVRDQFVKLAQCMREHGVNIPDPGPDGKIEFPKGDIDPGALEKARDACKADLPGAGR